MEELNLGLSHPKSLNSANVTGILSLLPLPSFVKQAVSIWWTDLRPFLAPPIYLVTNSTVRSYNLCMLNNRQTLSHLSLYLGDGGLDCPDCVQTFLHCVQSGSLVTGFPLAKIT